MSSISLYRLFMQLVLGSSLIMFGTLFVRPLIAMYESTEQLNPVIAFWQEVHRPDVDEKLIKSPRDKDHRHIDVSLHQSLYDEDKLLSSPGVATTRQQYPSSVSIRTRVRTDQENIIKEDNEDTNIDDTVRHLVAMGDVINNDYEMQLQFRHSTDTQLTQNGSHVVVESLVDTTMIKALPLTAEYEHRLRLVDEKCGTYQQTSRVLPGGFRSSYLPTSTVFSGEIGDNFFVNDQLRFVYCLVPKVACTTWSRVLLVAAGAYDKLPNELPQTIVNAERLHGSVLKRLSDYTPKEIDYRLKYYFKFMFVRHPFERLVSAYRDRLHSNHQIARNVIGKKIIQRYRQHNTTQKKRLRRMKSSIRNVPTFDEFVQYLVDPATSAEGPFNPHWRPQFELCQPCLLTEYDFIGHFETLSQDADFVLRSVLGQSASSIVEFPKFDPDNHGGGRRSGSSVLVDTMFAEIPEERRRKLREIYRLDFDLFGYD